METTQAATQTTDLRMLAAAIGPSVDQPDTWNAWIERVYGETMAVTAPQRKREQAMAATELAQYRAMNRNRR